MLKDGDEALIRLALSHVLEAQKISQGDDERVKLAQSKQLRAILDAAEARIRATGGIHSTKTCGISWTSITKR